MFKHWLKKIKEISTNNRLDINEKIIELNDLIPLLEKEPNKEDKPWIEKVKVLIEYQTEKLIASISKQSSSLENTAQEDLQEEYVYEELDSNFKETDRKPNLAQIEQKQPTIVDDLINAIKIYDLAAVKKIVITLDKSVNHDVLDKALFIAAENNFIEIFRFLLQNGANIYANDSNGNTVFDMATKYAHPTIVQSILQQDKQERKFYKLDVLNEKLKFAINHDQSSLLACLVNAGANIYYPQNSDGDTVFEYAVKCKKWNAAKKALEFDSKNKDSQYQKFNFIFSIITIEAPSLKEYIDVYFALTKLTLLSSKEKILLDNIYCLLGEKCSHLINLPITLDGDTALLDAVKQENEHMVINLMTSFSGVINVNSQDNDGNTPLHIAALNKYLTVVALLAHPKIDVSALNKNGDTPLHIAMNHGCLDIVHMILSHDSIDINKPNKDGNNVLHIALIEGYVDFFFELLARYDIDINKQNKDGNTVLHIALIEEHLDINFVNKILKLYPHNIDIAIQNNNGETLFDIATDDKYIAATNYLYTCLYDNCFDDMAKIAHNSDANNSCYQSTSSSGLMQEIPAVNSSTNNYAQDYNHSSYKKATLPIYKKKFKEETETKKIRKKINKPKEKTKEFFNPFMAERPSSILMRAEQHIDFTCEEIATTEGIMQKLTFGGALNVMLLPCAQQYTLQYKVTTDNLPIKLLHKKFLTSLSQSKIIIYKNQITYVELTITKDTTNAKHILSFTEQDVAVCRKNITALLATNYHSIDESNKQLIGSPAEDQITHQDDPPEGNQADQTADTTEELASIEELPLNLSDNGDFFIVQIITSLLKINASDYRIKFIVDKQAITIKTEFKGLSSGINLWGTLYAREVLSYIFEQIVTLYNLVNKEAISTGKIKSARLTNQYKDPAQPSTTNLYQAAKLPQDLLVQQTDNYHKLLLAAIHQDKLTPFAAKPPLLLFRSGSTDINYRHLFSSLIKLIERQPDGKLDNNLIIWLNHIAQTPIPEIFGIHYYHIKILDYIWTKAYYYSPISEQFIYLKNMRNALRHARNGDLEHLYITIRLLAKCILINTCNQLHNHLKDLEELFKALARYDKVEYSALDHDPKLLSNILTFKVKYLQKYLSDEIGSRKAKLNNLAIVSLTNDIRELIINLSIASYTRSQILNLSKEEAIQHILTKFLNHKEIITYIYIVSGHTRLEQELDINETANFIKSLLANGTLDTDIISNYGFISCDTIDDGNCLFHAVINQLTLRGLKNTNDHTSLRKEVVKHITENRELYLQQHLIEGDFDRHITTMARDKTWGGIVEILAIKEILRVNIVILSNGYHEPMIYKYDGYAHTQGTIYLEYSNNNHYLSLVDADPQSLTPSSVTNRVKLNKAISSAEFGTHLLRPFLKT